MSGDEEVVITREVRAGAGRRPAPAQHRAPSASVGGFHTRPAEAARRNRRNDFEEDRRLGRVGEGRAELAPGPLGRPTLHIVERKRKTTRNKKQIFESDSEEESKTDEKSPPTQKKVKVVEAKEAKKSVTLQGFLVELQREQELAGQTERKTARKTKRMASAEKRRAEMAAMAESPSEVICCPGSWEFVTKGRLPTPRVECPVGNLMNQEACRFHRARPSLAMVAKHLRERHGVSEVLGRGCRACGAPEVRVPELHLHFHCGAAPPAQPSLPVAGYWPMGPSEGTRRFVSCPWCPYHLVNLEHTTLMEEHLRGHSKAPILLGCPHCGAEEVPLAALPRHAACGALSKPKVTQEQSKTPARQSSKSKAQLSLTRTPGLHTFAFALPTDLSRVEEAKGITGIRVRTDIFRPSVLVAGIEENNNHFTFSKPMEFATS